VTYRPGKINNVAKQTSLVKGYNIYYKRVN